MKKGIVSVTPHLPNLGAKMKCYRSIIYHMGGELGQWR